MRVVDVSFIFITLKRGQGLYVEEGTIPAY